MTSEPSRAEPPRPADPDTIRDTLPIKPLSRTASKILVTAALLAAAALAVYASGMIRSLSSDPDVRARYEAVEEMRRQGLSPERMPIAVPRADSASTVVDEPATESSVPPDSL